MQHLATTGETAPVGDPVDVLDPPQFGAALGTLSRVATAGQFSPDGQWLYIIYVADFSMVSLGAVSAKMQGGLRVVHIRLSPAGRGDRRWAISPPA